MKLNPITWWQRRQMQIADDRYWIEHIAKTDVKENQRLAESYKHHSFRLVAVVVADIFMDTDIDELARSLDRRLKAPGYDQRKHRAQVRQMLRRARSKAGGREVASAIHFVRPGEGRKHLGGEHEMQLPRGVERVGLVLDQFAPGMLMAALVVGAAPDLAASVFERHHPSPVRRTSSGISWEVVETAKTRDLEARLRESADIDLLPRRAGLLRDRRFPDGALVVWSGDKFPSDDETAARDVTRILGIDAWQWWEADGRRFYYGAPVADRSPNGHSMILVERSQATERKEFATRESEMRFHLQLELHDWMPLLLLGESAVLLREQAGRLRESLARRESRLGRLWPFGLGTLVAGLSDLSYRLERLRQAANIDGKHRGFGGFPMMVFGRAARLEPEPSRLRRTLVRRIARWLESTIAEPRPLLQPQNLRQSWLESLDLVTRTALHEVRLSFERARLLSDIRSTNVLLGLTTVLAFLTLILVWSKAH